MNPDTRTQLRDAGLFVGGIAALVAVGLYLTPSPAPPPMFGIAWQNPGRIAGDETEVWQSSNLNTWALVAVTTSNRFDTPRTNTAAFFKIRNRRPDGGAYSYSDWCRK